MINEPLTLPNGFILSQNFPNPFNPRTTLRYHLSESSLVSLKIYDVLGREIKSKEMGTQTPGWQSVYWDGLNGSGQQVVAGVYLARLTANDHSGVVKMLLVR